MKSPWISKKRTWKAFHSFNKNLNRLFWVSHSLKRQGNPLTLHWKTWFKLKAGLFLSSKISLKAKLRNERLRLLLKGKMEGLSSLNQTRNFRWLSLRVLFRVFIEIHGQFLHIRKKVKIKARTGIRARKTLLIRNQMKRIRALKSIKLMSIGSIRRKFRLYLRKILKLIPLLRTWKIIWRV